MGNNIIVTGAAGFIGSNLTDALLTEGHKVLGIDNFDPFYSRAVKEDNISSMLRHPAFQFKEGDIRDSVFLDNCFARFNPDILIHLAAKAGVGPSISNSQEYYSINVMGTLNLLEVMRRNNVNNMIFASSSSVYGNNPKIPFSETDGVDYPISPYAASKKAGELLCYTYHHLFHMNILCLRFFTVYGPRQRPDLAIHKFVKAILNNETISIYGDGSSKRDYTHIDDIVQGIMGAIKNLNGYEIFNLGGSEPVSLIDLVSIIEKLTSRKAILNYLPLREGDVIQTFADVTKAREVLKFNPEVDIETGIKNYIQDFKNKSC
jgi:UDP-glucuronate 4-epimerase